MPVLILFYSRSIPVKRSAPKEGAAAKPAPTAEEIAEWKDGLEECMAEVKKLETTVIQY
jgi:H/ACA ribonucleoprotein complex subunit 2